MTENKSPVACFGYGLPAKPLDQFLIHEGMDRAYMLHTMVETFLREHGLTMADEKYRAHISAASDALFDAYQRAGELSV
jgi:hypothetical protein